MNTTRNVLIVGAAATMLAACASRVTTMKSVRETPKSHSAVGRARGPSSSRHQRRKSRSRPPRRPAATSWVPGHLRVEQRHLVMGRRPMAHQLDPRDAGSDAREPARAAAAGCTLGAGLLRTRRQRLGLGERALAISASISAPAALMRLAPRCWRLLPVPVHPNPVVADEVPSSPAPSRYPAAAARAGSLASEPASRGSSRRAIGRLPMTRCRCSPHRGPAPGL